MWLVNHSGKGLEEHRVDGHIVSTVRKQEGADDAGAQFLFSTLFSLGVLTP